jgi:hypothetical protein
LEWSRGIRTSKEGSVTKWKVLWERLDASVGPLMGSIFFFAMFVAFLEFPGADAITWGGVVVTGWWTLSTILLTLAILFGKYHQWRRWLRIVCCHLEMRRDSS